MTNDRVNHDYISPEDDGFLSYPLPAKLDGDLPIVTPSRLFASMRISRQETADMDAEQKQALVDQWILSNGQPKGLLRDLLVATGIELMPGTDFL